VKRTRLWAARLARLIYARWTTRTGHFQHAASRISDGPATPAPSRKCKRVFARLFRVASTIHWLAKASTIAQPTSAQVGTLPVLQSACFSIFHWPSHRRPQTCMPRHARCWIRALRLPVLRPVDAVETPSSSCHDRGIFAFVHTSLQRCACRPASTTDR
jgi:hypothetical protein